MDRNPYKYNENGEIFFQGEQVPLERMLQEYLVQAASREKSFPIKLFGENTIPEETKAQYFASDSILQNIGNVLIGLSQQGRLPSTALNLRFALDDALRKGNYNSDNVSVADILQKLNAR